MTSREIVRTIISGKEADRVGFWLGKPHADTEPIYIKAFGQKDIEGVRRFLGDDMRWINPQWISYKHPAGRPIFDMQRKGKELSAAGIFSDCEDAAEVDDFPWPNPDYLDFTATLQHLDQAGDVYRASGFWCPFFHELADFFGMENYFVKMYTHPDVVHAVTRRVIDFYLEANRRFYDVVGDRIDGFFFGNDFGTQLDLLVGPAQFEEFIFPYFKELTDQGHRHGYQVILHSCGSIYKVIPKLIELGVEALHPLQAKAANMEAERLAREFKGKVAFIGGIDTQELLVHGTPEQVRADVRRVKNLLGPCLVVSPSHEALLPNVPPDNVRAMAEAALE
ncbi:MAG: uroporphyrinogen decarboxylase family protein [Candidatus Zhuqueibacterota bacterium]